MKNRILVDCVASGQRGPYTDSIYVYEVVFEVEKGWGDDKGEWMPRTNMQESDALAAVKIVGRQFKALDEKPDWYECRLTGVERLAENRFRVSLIQEYTG